MGNKHTLSDLYQMQAMPLSVKIRMTKYRIKQWIERYGEDGVYISFSGGKDSTVLLDIVRQDYPNIPAVFVDVPTQYPELKEFVKTFENVEILKPKISFMEVCKRYGFPMFSKEISGCIGEARKYFENLEKENNQNTILTDRQTDRTAGSPTEQRLEVNMQGTSNCLTSVQKDNMVSESVLAVDEQNMNVRKETFGTLTTDGSSPKHNNRVMIKQATQYRIRKLTPRECGRLMGVSDEDIDKMAAVNSNTQLYKQFGNSIVVDVMCAMFKNLNIEQESEIRN